MCQRPWRHGPPPWMEGVHGKRRFVFRRFALFFGLFFLLFVLAIVLVVWLSLGPLHGNLGRPVLWLVTACAVPLAFLLLLTVVGRTFFRQVGRPLAEVMAAADSVADGDLSIRVSEHAPGEFGRLAKSFNRMAAELQRAEQQRQNLTADVAHELRTPLHIIQGNLEGLIDGVYEPTPEHVQATLEETRLLARLVEDLQTLSLAEAGQLPLHPAQLSALDLLSDVATSFSGQASEKGVEIQTVVSAGDKNLQINADPDRLDQVLSNLVANALRYTPPGGKITLSAESFPGGVRLAVADNGTGIDPADLPFIFDRFWRADRARGRAEGAGSGLGLAIARQLVQAHKGRISASSQPGQGTTFTIELPL